MYYTVYQITNLVNGKTYIGCHKTKDLEDDYIGSGKILGYAKEKYGIENFEKKYLAVFNNSEEMFEMESELVNESFVSRNDTYNIKKGGLTRHITDAELSLLISEGLKKAYPNGREPNITYGFQGKEHKELAKRKIGAANSIHQKGSGNSQFGTCWIHNTELKQNKKIKKDNLNDWLSQGWIKGRKMKFMS